MIGARLASWAETRIQRKLVLALGIPLVLVSALFLVLVSAIYRHQLISVHARAASQINELMQGTLENAMLKRDIPGLMAILEGVGEQEDIARVMILDPAFEVRFSTDPGRVGVVLDNADTARALIERTPSPAIWPKPDRRAPRRCCARSIRFSTATNAAPAMTKRKPIPSTGFWWSITAPTGSAAKRLAGRSGWRCWGFWPPPLPQARCGWRCGAWCCGRLRN